MTSIPVIGFTHIEKSLPGKELPVRGIPAATVGCKKRELFSGEVKALMKTITSWEDGRLEAETFTPDVKGPLLFPVLDLNQAGDALFREDDFNRKIIENLPGWFYVMDQELRLVLWNDNLRMASGCSNEELQGMSVLDFHDESQHGVIAEEIGKIFRLGEYASEADVVFKDGTIRTLFFNSRRIVYNNTTCLVGTAFDVTEQKKAESNRRLFTKNLEKINTAARVFIHSGNEGQNATEDKLKANLQDLVIPHLKKLKASSLNAAQRKHLKALEDSLQDVLSPFVTSLLLTYSNLTPQEIQVADLIRRGNGTKEIADALNTSANTIATHRNNIRKKLDLRNTKVNLRTHLQSIL